MELHRLPYGLTYNNGERTVELSARAVGQLGRREADSIAAAICEGARSAWGGGGRLENRYPSSVAAKMIHRRTTKLPRRHERNHARSAVVTGPDSSKIRLVGRVCEEAGMRIMFKAKYAEASADKPGSGLGDPPLCRLRGRNKGLFY